METLGVGYYYQLYMVPKDPANKDAPTQEFCIQFKQHNRSTDKKIRNAMREYEAKFHRLLLRPTDNLCIIRDTTLWFDLDLVAYEDILWGDIERPGILVGAYWTVDLTKLKNIKNEEIATGGELLAICGKQAGDHKFVNAAVFHIAEEAHFWEFDNNIGFINVFRHNAGYSEKDSVVHTYPANLNEIQGTIIDTKLPGESIHASYSLHPHGALLHFLYDTEKSIYLRVLKCLKPNLKSVALNKVLFHKNTPIRYHPAYRLCFNGTKPEEYARNIDDKKSLIRKLSED